MHAASQQLLRLQDPAALAATIIDILERELTYDHGAVLLIDHATQVLVPYALSDQGKGEPFRTEDMAYVHDAKVRVGEGITGWVARHGESVIIDDVRTDGRYRALRDNIRSELCVPLRLEERIVGVVNIESVEVAKYGLLDLRVLETIAAQMAIAIENARLYSEARRHSRNRLVAELAGGIAHDVGNLFSVASMEAAVIASGNATDEEQRASAARVGDAAAMGIKLISRVLRTGRDEVIDRDTLAVTNLSYTLSELGDLLTAIGRGGISVSVKCPDGRLMVPLSAAAVDQIVLNLVVNACQAMNYEGEITVEVAESPAAEVDRPSAILRVTDTGCGMSEETLRLAFEPYFTTRPSGTGLGLSTVYRLANNAGGTVSIRSAPDCGTAVTVRLPLVKK